LLFSFESAETQDLHRQGTAIQTGDIKSISNFHAENVATSARDGSE